MIQTLLLSKLLFKEIIQLERDLTEIAQLVSKDSLAEDQKLIFEFAKVINMHFLQQNSFTKWDYRCPLYKTLGMMRCICRFYDHAKRIILESSMKDTKRISLSFILDQLHDQYYELSQMKFQDPEQPREDLEKYFGNLCDDIDEGFRNLQIG